MRQQRWSPSVPWMPPPCVFPVGHSRGVYAPPAWTSTLSIATPCSPGLGGAIHGCPLCLRFCTMPPPCVFLVGHSQGVYAPPAPTSTLSIATWPVQLRRWCSWGLGGAIVRRGSSGNLASAVQETEGGSICWVAPPVCREPAGACTCMQEERRKWKPHVEVEDEKTNCNSLIPLTGCEPSGVSLHSWPWSSWGLLHPCCNCQYYLNLRALCTPCTS
jgi:hypothetical protein